MQWVEEPQDGITPLLQAINTAQSIDVNEYLLTNPQLVTALIHVSNSGHPVDVILAHNPYDDAAAIPEEEQEFAGSHVILQWAPTRFPGNYAFDHAKYWIFNPTTSHATGLIGSLNGTDSATDGTNAEDAILTSHPSIVHALTTVFHADWTHTSAGNIPRQHLVVSPGSGPDLTALLESSGPIAITSEELGDAPAEESAIAAHGPTARVLLPASLSSTDRLEAARLQQQGVNVRTLATPYVHAKTIITSQDTFVGSQNFSEPSLNNNREVGLIVNNPTIHQEALTWFNHLWDQAQPLSTNSPVSQSPSSTSHSSTSLPYLSQGASPSTVLHLWGSPTKKYTTTYHGTPETVWTYTHGTVYFEHQHVVYVTR